MSFRRILAGAALAAVIGIWAPAAGAGTLAIIGGGLRVDNDAVWSRIVDAAGGKGARIAIIPSASGNPAKYGGMAVDTFARLGADAFLVPLSPTEGKFPEAYAELRRDPEWIKRVSGAKAVYFVGGDQARLVKALLAEDGSDSPMMAAIREVYQGGGVVAGTSAGAAVMSDPMIRDVPDTLAVLDHGVAMGREVDRGLGLMPKGWLVDQHFLVRGRFARSLAAMRALGLKHGVGIDENTAVLVHDGRTLEVVGYRGAVVLDIADATWTEGGRFNIKNARLTYLDRGDSIDLGSLQVTPSPAKAADLRIDPASAHFDPYNSDYFFAPDILGNSALYDVMTNLIDNKVAVADGIAFRKDAASAPATGGYAFHFYRGADSMGWYTGKLGADDYTVVNLHLDIRPADMAELLGPTPAGDK